MSNIVLFDNFQYLLSSIKDIFDLNNKDIYNASNIPISIYTKFLKGELVFNQEDWNKFDNFLINLERMVDSEIRWKLLQSIKDETINVKKLPSSSYSYKIISKDDLFDIENTLYKKYGIEMLEKLKACGLDWYYKFLTLFKVFYKTGNLPMRNLYFYDGTYVYKWLTTQKRALSGKNGLYLVDMQNYFAKELLKINEAIEIRKRFQSDLLLRIRANFDKYYLMLKKVILETKQVPKDETINGINLYDVYRTFCSVYNNTDDLLTISQYKKIKEIRNLVIYNDRLSRNYELNNVSLDFGLHLKYFLDTFNYSFDQFAELVDCSKAALNNYSQNLSIPSIKILNNILGFLDSIRSNLREDRLEAIEDFEKVLLFFKQSRESMADDISVIKNNVKCSGDFYKDIDRKFIDKVQQEDDVWYKQFLGILNKIQEHKLDAKVGGLRLSLYSWVKVNYQRMLRNELSSEQIILFKYILVYNDFVLEYKENAEINNRLDAFESFVNINRHFPEPGEFRINGDIDANLFFVFLRESYFSKRDERRYANLNDETLLRLRNLFLLRLDMMDYYKAQPDGVSEDGKVYAGEIFNKIRVVFRISNHVFSSLISDRFFVNEYINKSGVKLDELVRLNNYLDTFEVDKLDSVQKEAIDSYKKFFEEVCNCKNVNRLLKK